MIKTKIQILLPFPKTKSTEIVSRLVQLDLKERREFAAMLENRKGSKERIFILHRIKWFVKLKLILRVQMTGDWRG